MRQVTRRFLIGLAAVLVGLLALGALPSLLASGDAYYLTATPVDVTGPAVDVANLSEQRYPYTTTAIANASVTTSSAANGSTANTSDGDAAIDPSTDDRVGVAGPYYRGPVGFKEAFTHSPFDEVDALGLRRPGARTQDGAVIVTTGNQRFRIAVTQDPP